MHWCCHCHRRRSPYDGPHHSFIVWHYSLCWFLIQSPRLQDIGWWHCKHGVTLVRFLCLKRQSLNCPCFELDQCILTLFLKAALVECNSALTTANGRFLVEWTSALPRVPHCNCWTLTTVHDGLQSERKSPPLKIPVVSSTTVKRTGILRPCRLNVHIRVRAGPAGWVFWNSLCKGKAREGGQTFLLQGTFKVSIVESLRLLQE